MTIQGPGRSERKNISMVQLAEIIPSRGRGLVGRLQRHALRERGQA